MRHILSVCALFVGALVLAQPPQPAAPAQLKVLFLGDTAGHRPAERFKQLRPVLAKRGIELTYTDKLEDLNAETLNGYDALMVFANHTKIAPGQEKALLEYVESGKGFVPLHCASYCFLNSPKYIEMVGAQFRSHGTGTFRTETVKADHPIMKGFKSFSSWDETYVHTKHNDKGRTVLEVRAEGDLKEPWTWVREQGKGRVFYTAWGHDQRTWGHPGFHNLVERGVRWACGQDPAIAGAYVEPLSFEKPQMTKLAKDAKPFEYVEANVPFYPPSKKWGVQADPVKKMQKPLPVGEGVKHIVTPVGFAVKVFVTEEKLGGKPIAMTWDERGRLFVAVTADYPNELQREGAGRDRIVVCEDTDGDGTCDTVATFADKLSIPTSLLPYAGGLLVTQAPHTLFLTDADGDGRADVRQVLFTGWATNDTHAGPSNLRYGFDGWVYGAVGYAGYRGTVNGEQHSFRQGFFRFKIERSRARDDFGAPSVTKLEFLRSTNNNTWGLCFDETGELFGSTANGCPIVHMPVPNRYYEKVRGLSPAVLQNIAPDNHIEPITEKVRQVDWHGGFTAASHIAVYTARTYPREYWNRTAFISEPTGHLTATMTLRPDGTGFKAEYGWNLLASDDEWCAPIDAQVGPDGHMWVLDWYNFIVQHNPTPAGFKTGRGNAYETDLRDKKYGRIYRVVYTGAKGEKPFTLAGAKPEQLVEALKHDNMTWRLHAQRLLADRADPGTVGALLKLLEDRTVDATGNNPAAVHALHLLAPHAAKDETVAEAVLGALKHPAAPVRAAGYAALPRQDKWFAALPEAAFAEADPKVRKAALLALSELPPGAGGAFALARFLPHTADSEVASPALLAAVAVHHRALLAAVADLPDRAALLPLVESAARAFAASGDYTGLDGALAAAARAKPGVAARVVAGLAAGWPAAKGAQLNADGEKAIGALLPQLPATDRGRLLKLASAWGVKGIDAQLAEITRAAFATLADERAKDDARVSAAQQVVEFQPDSDDAAAKLLAAVTPESSAALASGVFEALAQSRAKGAAVAVVAKLKDLPPTVRPTALKLVLAKTDSTKAFLGAVEKGVLRFDALALDQRAALASHPDKDVSERAKKLLALGGGLPNADRQKVIEELKHILAKSGDAANGKKMFAAHCAKCHKHGAEGVAIGPDLTGFGVHPKEEILIHVIDPSRSVEGNFKLYRVTTADDRTILGILGATTGTTVEIVDADAKRHPLQKSDIVTLKETDKSLMPEGFEKVMKVAELTDLMEFLTQKGKFVPLPLDKVATVVSTKDMFFDAGGTNERLVFPDWKPKTFDGVPFVLVDPQGDTVKNAVLLYGPNGVLPPKMPKSVSLPFNGKAKAVHLLSGVGGWSAQRPNPNGPVSVIVRLVYEDGTTEDHRLRDGVHFADYIGKFDVPGSKHAFALRGQQIRYLSVEPKRPDAVVKTIELVKGSDRSAPIVMALTVESP